MTTCFWKTLDYPISGMDLFLPFAQRPLSVFLDSSLSRSLAGNLYGGRYSLIGIEPFDVFMSNETDALDKLKKKFIEWANLAPDQDKRSPLSSGIIGYLSYDLGLRQNGFVSNKLRNNSAPDCYFAFYDSMITIDHAADKIYISSTGFPEKTGSARESRAKAKIEWIEEQLTRPGKKWVARKERHAAMAGAGLMKPLKSNLTKEEYLKAVRQALEHIRQGDIYQVNLSQQFSLDMRDRDIDTFEVYKTLRALSPSGFGGYLNGGDFQILSSSPERFLRLEDNIIETKPMKGTRPRGVNRAMDRIYRDELVLSPKDISELLMITDLERNDLGKVCDFGTVQVEHMREIEEYSTVFQATSTIKGQLRDDKDSFDVIKACFPGGSITGCPKIRAMKIIEDLEPSRRSIYTGALGYISFSGEMDFNIMIRTMLASDHKLFFSVGGGIVADSDPESEYQETLVKAQAIQKSLSDWISRYEILHPSG
jgi:para-aminobenzoate synthetase component 1